MVKMALKRTERMTVLLTILCLALAIVRAEIETLKIQ